MWQPWSSHKRCSPRLQTVHGRRRHRASRLVRQSFARMREACQACYNLDDDNRDGPHSPSGRAHRTAATLRVPYHPSPASRCRPLSVRTSSRAQLFFPSQGRFDWPVRGAWRMSAPGFSRGHCTAPAVACRRMLLKIP